MAFSIKSAEADRLARELALITHESLTTAVLIALEERLQRTRRQQLTDIVARLDRLVADYTATPPADERRADDIIGYGPDGAPG